MTSLRDHRPTNSNENFAAIDYEFQYGEKVVIINGTDSYNNNHCIGLTGMIIGTCAIDTTVDYIVEFLSLNGAISLSFRACNLKAITTEENIVVSKCVKQKPGEQIKKFSITNANFSVKELKIKYDLDSHTIFYKTRFSKFPPYEIADNHMLQRDLEIVLFDNEAVYIKQI